MGSDLAKQRISSGSVPNIFPNGFAEFTLYSSQSRKHACPRATIRLIVSDRKHGVKSRCTESRRHAIKMGLTGEPCAEPVIPCVHERIVATGRADRRTRDAGS